MISCVQELENTFKMAKLLFLIPTKVESWITPKGEGCVPSAGSLDEVTLKIAGMPLMWKVVNMVIIVIPKAVLWKQLVETGFVFLMETSGIVDIIINCVGLTFIMGLDEAIHTTLSSEETQDVVSACENHDLFDPTDSCVGDMSLLTDDEILSKYAEQQGLLNFNFKDLFALLPHKLIITTVLTVAFVYEYYFKYCNWTDENRWISKAMYLPKSVMVSWLWAFFPAIFPLEWEEEPYWQMPGE